MLAPRCEICYNSMMNRQKAIVQTSIIGVVANIILVCLKLLVGLLAGSIAIILDAINNLTDVFSSVVTIVGTKLANRSPDAGHPYGHGRMEYLTTLIIGIIILITGIMAITESIPKIIHPELADYTWETIIVVVLAIIIKLLLGAYVRRAGKKYASSSLVASGIDALFDALLSFATLIGIGVTLILHVSIDGILGLLISLFIIKTSIEILSEASDDILGRVSDRELMRKIRDTICDFPNVSGAYDLMLHNYGPTELIGSVQIQVPDELTAKDIHRLTQEIAHKVYNKYHLNLTIGIYADNSTKPEHREIREYTLNIVNTYQEITQIHGLYIDDERHLITFDIVVPVQYVGSTELKNKVIKDMKKSFPNYKYMITTDIDLG